MSSGRGGTARVCGPLNRDGAVILTGRPVKQESTVRAAAILAHELGGFR